MPYLFLARDKKTPRGLVSWVDEMQDVCETPFDRLPPEVVWVIVGYALAPSPYHTNDSDADDDRDDDTSWRERMDLTTYGRMRMACAGLKCAVDAQFQMAPPLRHAARHQRARLADRLSEVENHYVWTTDRLAKAEAKVVKHKRRLHEMRDAAVILNDHYMRLRHLLISTGCQCYWYTDEKGRVHHNVPVYVPGVPDPCLFWPPL